MANWISLSLNDLLDDTEPPRPNHGHSYMVISKYVSWPHFCKYCGHVPLKNGISQLVSKIGCGYERDPRYVAWVKGGRKPI